jgi:hypothetical protein
LVYHNTAWCLTDNLTIFHNHRTESLIACLLSELSHYQGARDVVFRIGIWRLPYGGLELGRLARTLIRQKKPKRKRRQPQKVSQKTAPGR